MKNSELINILSKLPSDARVNIIETDGTYYSRIFKIRYIEQEGYSNIPPLKNIQLSLEPVWKGEENITPDDIWINEDIIVPPHCYTCDNYNHLKDNCNDGRIMDPACRHYTNSQIPKEY